MESIYEKCPQYEDESYVLRQCRLNNVNKLVDDLYQETDGKSDGLIVIGRCNKEALKSLKNKFKNLATITL